MAGRDWLSASPTVHLPPGELFGLAEEIAGAFKISIAEALVAVLGALSLAIGPSAYARNPFGPRIPLTLQLAVISGINPNFERCIRFLCQMVIDSYASEFGRRGIEDTKTLTTDQIVIERRIRVRDEEIAELTKLERETGNLSGSNYEKLHKLKIAAHTDLVSYVRLLRKKVIFPFGSIVSGKLIDALIEEDKDTCFGSLSTDGSALRYLLDATTPERSKITAFLNAGILGEAMTDPRSNPVYPIASAVWLCGSDLIEEAVAKRLHHSLTGLMVATVRASSHSALAVLPQETREKWRVFIGSLVRNTRTSFYRRNTGGCRGLTYELDAEATQALGKSMDWSTRFTTAPGYARTLLGRAPEQILKIASLLNIHPTIQRPVDAPTVLLATELYRFLARGTIQVDSNHHEAALARDVAALQEKLNAQGPLSRRDLIRTYHRQDYGKLNTILSSALNDGNVIHERGKYRTTNTMSL